MKNNEIVVISGKGGTGKTTVVSSIIPFIDNPIIADCDVDAPDLHILFKEKTLQTEKFIGLKKAIINQEKCIKCGKCYKHCKFQAINKEIILRKTKCEGCGVCEYVCPVSAIEMKNAVVGELYISESKYGKMVHAKLIPGEETSGKLVAEVRRNAKKIAEKNGNRNIIVDGSPGTACNVISSITGASKVIIVTEPTMSGFHDLIRVYEVTQKFNLKTYVVINKFDISFEETEKIENFCKEKEIKVLFKIPFEKKIVEAISKKEIPSKYAKELFGSMNFQKMVIEELIK